MTGATAGAGVEEEDGGDEELGGRGVEVEEEINPVVDVVVEEEEIKPVVDVVVVVEEIKPVVEVETPQKSPLAGPEGVGKGSWRNSRGVADRSSWSSA